MLADLRQAQHGSASATSYLYKPTRLQYIHDGDDGVKPRISIWEKEKKKKATNTWQ